MKTYKKPSPHVEPEVEHEVATSPLPEKYAKAKPVEADEDDIVELVETFHGMLPDGSAIPGVGESRQIRDHRNHVDEVLDVEGRPAFDYRFCTHAYPNRRERAVEKGFVPLYVKDRKPVPPGTPGATRVTVAGADLLVRRGELARNRRAAHDAEAVARSRKRPEGAPLPTGVAVTEDKSRTVVVTSIGAGKEL